MSEEIKDQVNPIEALTEAPKEDVFAAAPLEEASDSQQSAMSDIMILKKGDIVKGRIVKVDEDQAFVDIGYKYDGIIPVQELSVMPQDQATHAVQVGDEVELKVLSLDDGKEKLLLSKRVIDSENALQILQSKLESKEIIEAKVVEVVKGGLVVDVGVRGFVPASMVERSYVEDFSDYKNRTLRLRVKEIDLEKNKVILSQKDILDEEYEDNKKVKLSSIKVGQIIEGEVQRLAPFGAFVDIGGIDGLVHISELAWHHVQQASEVVQVGDRVQVQVLKIDLAQDKISLSLKATQEGPWSKVNHELKVGDVISGKVTRLTNFGAFIEVSPNLEGLVHISQIAHRHIGTPHEVLKTGQSVQVKILEINATEKRISLSIKETEDAPAEPQANPKNRERKSNTNPNQSSNHQKDLAGNQNISLSREALTTTLAERIGDKLKHFNK